MPRCALIVEFDAQPGKQPEILSLIREHARLTLAEEPGCRQFDVLAPEDGNSRVLLVEVYDDRAAYEAHRKNPRMPGVNASLDSLLTGRKVTVCTIE